MLLPPSARGSGAGPTAYVTGLFDLRGSAGPPALSGFGAPVLVDSGSGVSSAPVGLFRSGEYGGQAFPASARPQPQDNPAGVTATGGSPRTAPLHDVELDAQLRAVGELLPTLPRPADDGCLVQGRAHRGGVLPPGELRAVPVRVVRDQAGAYLPSRITPGCPGRPSG